MNAARWHIDFETRCVLSIKDVGAFRYTEHPSCEVLCCGYGPSESDIRLWIPYLDSPPEDLFEHINSGGILVAHNAFFEQCVFRNVCAPKYGWPVPAIKQFRCTAAKAASHALPRNLFDAGTELRLPVVKDKIGKKAMEKLCKPRNPKKGEPKNRVYWNYDVKAFDDLCAYNITDVKSEYYVDEVLPDLIPQEQSLWYLDQHMNLRGVQVDVPAITRMAELVREKEDLLRKEFLEIVKDGVLSKEETAKLLRLREMEPLFKDAFSKGGTARHGKQKVAELRATKKERDYLETQILRTPEQSALFKKWLELNGCPLPDLKKETVSAWRLRDDLPKHVRRALKVRDMICKKSTAKLKKAILAVCKDGRLRDLLMYWGAKTGRWTGKLVQIHNLPKGKMSDSAAAIEYCMTHTLDEIEAKYEMSVMDVASSCLRGMLIASPGMDMFAADYSAVESRGVSYLANDVKGLEEFEKGINTYLEMASAIYGRPCFKYTKADGTGADKETNDDGTKNIGSKEYMLGKQAKLGCGYQMGAAKFKITCEGYKIDLSEVASYDFCMKGALLSKVKTKGKEAEELGKLIAALKAQESVLNDPNETWYTKDEAAAETRKIVIAHGFDPALLVAEHVVNVYRTKHAPVVKLWDEMNKAAIAAVKTKHVVRCGKVSFRVEGKFLKMRLPSGRDLSYPYPEVHAAVTSYGKMTENLTYMGKDSTSASKGWHRLSTYGGKLTENAVQAICRDLLAEAMIRLKIAGYEPLFTVHDELVCERKEGEGSIEEYVAIMVSKSKWAEGFPVEIGKSDAWIGKRYKK